MAKKIVIIGGGVSGLSAGIFALKYGFDVTIVEKNPNVGGLCTGWYRKGFYIDGCVHWFNGTLKGSALYNDWHFIDAIKDENDFINLDSWYSFDVDGKIVTLYSDIDKTEKELIEMFPLDTRAIKSFIKMVKRVSKFNLPVEYPLGAIPIKRIFKFIYEYLKFSPTLIYAMLINKNKYVNKKFKSPELKYALINTQNLKENLYTLLYSYSCVITKNGGIPLNGSISIVNRMKSKFESLGGKILLNSEVNKCSIEDNNIKSISIKDKGEIKGDYFISAIEPDYLFSKLIDSKYKPKGFIKRTFNPNKYISPSCVLIYFAVKDMLDIGLSKSIKCEPFKIGENTYDCIMIRNYYYDPIYKKDDKVVIQVLIEQTNNDYEYWVNLHNIYEEYINVKKEIADIIKNRIINKYPSLKDNMELLDVVTPMTFKRYVNATKGCYMSYTYAQDGPLFYHSGKVKGINNLYLASQWEISPGGLPLALTCGKFASMRIAKKEKINIYR